MTNKPSVKDKDYFMQLASMIDNCGAIDYYSTVLLYLYNSEFWSDVDDDTNRIEDALLLRRSINGPVIRHISVLEVMIALAKRCHEDIMLGYEINGEPSSTAFWFWIFMENVGFDQLSDQKIGDIDTFETNFYRILETILGRTYNYDGRGGFFPLHEPNRDQRSVGLWYQLHAYLLENFPL